MTDQEINIAIAEACGWKKVKIDNSKYTCGSHGCTFNTHIQWVEPGSNYAPMVHDGIYTGPDYCNDLNAMHDVEKKFTTSIEQQAYYENLLFTMFTDPTGDGSPIEMWAVTHASAHQRAEAFLRAKGLWKNE